MFAYNNTRVNHGKMMPFTSASFNKGDVSEHTAQIEHAQHYNVKTNAYRKYNSNYMHDQIK